MGDSRKINDFADWLQRRGKSVGTVDLYSFDVKGALAAGGFIARLIEAQERGLAPKTRRRIRTAGIQWSRFVEDEKLERQLRDFQLPKSKRATAKTPLLYEQREKLIAEIESAEDLSEFERAVIGMIACRGFRIGDVLRLKRTELRTARDHGVLAFRAKGENRLEFRLNSTFTKHAVVLANAEGSWATVDELIVPDSKNAKARRKSAARQITRTLARLAERCDIVKIYPHQLRRTYAVEYLKGLKGDPDALMKLKQHMQWEALATAAEYVDHDRGVELDEAAERIFKR
jgi:site-specific recombinase XerD